MRSTRRWKSAPNHPWQRPSAVPRPWAPHNSSLHIKASFWVAAMWVVVIVGSMSVLAMTPLTRSRVQKPRLSRSFFWERDHFATLASSAWALAIRSRRRLGVMLQARALSA